MKRHMIFFAVSLTAAITSIGWCAAYINLKIRHAEAITLNALKQLPTRSASHVYSDAVTNWFSSNTVIASACGHNGRLDTINYSNTWRVEINDFVDAKTEVELGICKTCGLITDHKQSGPSGGGAYASHFPIAGSPFYRSRSQRKADNEKWERIQQEASRWPTYRSFCEHDSLADILTAISNCPPRHWVTVGPGKWEVEPNEFGAVFWVDQLLPKMTGLKGMEAKFFTYQGDDHHESSITIGTIMRGE